MKIKTILAGLVFLASSGANAATVFAPTDGDVNFLFSALTSGVQLAMFDDSDQTYAGSSLDIAIPEIIGIAGPFGGGDYIATNGATDTLTLSFSDQFILGVSTDGGMNWIADSSVISAGANAYTVQFGANGSILEVDVKILLPPDAIPVPAAVWLFGSGLLGLVGIARRKKAV